MRTPPAEMIRVLAPFAPLFSKRIWQYAQTLLMGVVLAQGKRTVSSALRAIGLDQEKRFHRYHRVLSRAKWSTPEASRVLLGLLVEAFVPEGPLVLGVDETLERCQGKKIAARGSSVTLCIPATPTSSRPALSDRFALRCWPRSHGQDEFGRCLSFPHSPLPNDTPQSEASDIRRQPNWHSRCSCWSGAGTRSAKS